jgi:hypothetical protein
VSSRRLPSELGSFWFALCAGALGCSQPPDTSSGADPALSPVVCHPGFTVAEQTPIVPLFDGDPIVVRYAPQGGQVMWIAARVSGLEPGPAQLSAKLVDPDTGEDFVTDSRIIELRELDDGSGELEPDLGSSANFSHLVACPNYGPRPVEGVEWLLSVEVSDPKHPGHAGSASVRVIPGCAEGPRKPNCQCECSPDYTFGKCGAPI